MHRCHSYKFRQASNFWYLTGWEEPDSVVVLGASHAYLLNSHLADPRLATCRKDERLARVQDDPVLSIQGPER